MGVMIAVVIGNIFAVTRFNNNHHDDAHVVGYADNAEEVHIHADFLVAINGQLWDFTADKYQSSSTQKLADDIHLHDHQGNVLHRHASGITIGDFFSSLGFTLSNDCLITDTKETYCGDEENVLQVYVNGEKVTAAATYIPAEEDQILVYFGRDEQSLIEPLLSDITDEACIYSGTCPERGTPPPEACGLTCEM